MVAYWTAESSLLCPLAPRNRPASGFPSVQTSSGCDWHASVFEFWPLLLCAGGVQSRTLQFIIVASVVCNGLMGALNLERWNPKQDLQSSNIVFCFFSTLHHWLCDMWWSLVSSSFSEIFYWFVWDEGSLWTNLTNSKSVFFVFAVIWPGLTRTWKKKPPGKLLEEKPMTCWSWYKPRCDHHRR